MKKLILTTAILITATTALAKEMPLKIPASPCKGGNYITDSYINVSLTDTAESYSSAQQKYNQKLKVIEATAKDMGIEIMDLQNSSMNISPNNINGVKIFSISGSISYKTPEKEDKVFAFLDSLQQKNIDASFNSNKRYSDSCGQ